MSTIWKEVKSRNIFKAATIYAAIAWGVIQIADVLLPVLGVANWVMSSMVLLAFSGFPVALIVGWMLDFRIERKKLTNALEDENSSEITKQSITARIAEVAVISLFGVGATYLYYNSANEPVQASIEQNVDLNKILSPVEQQKTIAVLPFVNFSDSSQDEFFADGLSEELLNVLARNKKLRVAARTSSFQYKNTNINVKTIASELGVQYIIEGSVRRSGDLIRVTTQLIKADEDTHVFSKSWDRNTTNVFKVQDEIAQSVMDELKVSLFGEAKQEFSEIGTQDIAAFADYSRGLSMLRNRTKTDFDGAIIHFENALKKDKNYAEAMTMLAQTYLLQASYGMLTYPEAFKRTKPLLSNVFKINPQLGSAHAVKGLMHWQLSNGSKESNQHLKKAKAYLVKAIDINPSIAEAYMWYGSILQDQGLFAEGAKLRKKAFEIDPQAAVVGYNRAKDLVRYGDYKQAMDVFNTVVRNNPNYPNAYSIAGDVSYAVGQLDQAYGMYHRLAEFSEDKIDWLVSSSRLYIPMGEFQLAQNNIEKLQQSSTKEHLKKFSSLQANIWIASNNLKSFYQWTSEFPEETKNWVDRLWRGFAMLKQQKWQFAIDDLKQALMLSRENNTKRVDENTIRIQLMLVGAYQGSGNQLKSEHFLSQVNREIEQLKQQGFDSQTLRYQQAEFAALNNDNEKALKLLRQSVHEGFVNFWWAEADPAFDLIRKKPLYISIRDEFQIRMRLMKSNIESQYGKLALNN